MKLLKIANCISSVFITFYVFCIPLTFAGLKDIDHEIAEAEIQKNIIKNDLRFTLHLQKGAFEKGVQQEMWNQEGNLKSRAASSGLKSLKRTSTGDYIISSQNSNIRFKITDFKDINLGMKFKRANFNWWYDSEVPPLWKRFIVAGGRGYVVFALHDDGWQYDGIEFEYSEEPFPRSEKEIAEEQNEIRLHDDGWQYDGIEFEYSEEPFPRSEKEIAEEQNEIRQIETLKHKEEEKERTLVQVHQKRLTESKKATKDLGTFILSRREGPETCKVSDAGVSCKKIENGIEESYTIMFADIRSIRKAYYPGPVSSDQYSAIEIETPDKQMASWKYYTQWLSQNKDDINRFFDALTGAHKEWRKKFSDIAE